LPFASNGMDSRQNGAGQRPKRAALHTLGCRLNQSETLLIQQRLQERGYQIVPFNAEADVGIVNTCTVTQLADAKSRQTIRQFTRRNPKAFTAVIGCYAQLGAREIAAIPGVDLVVGNHDKMSVLDYIGQEKLERPIILRERIRREDFSISVVGDVPFDQRANLKVQDGCSFACSFCVIPFARGAARSRDLENTLEEARAKVRQGVREIVLTGVNIGLYRSGETDFLRLVERLDAVPGIDRIRIGSIEPTTIPEALFGMMSDPQSALLPFIHVPLQSGSDRVLREMRRKYSVSEYMEFMERALAKAPGAYVGTDLLAGFPGETEADFERTCSTFLDGPFHFAHVFSYSERQGTPAARRDDSVPDQERRRRSAYLRRLAAKKRHDFHESRLGQERRVLFENPRPEGWPAYTDDYARVLLPAGAAAGRDLRNRMGRVRLARLAGDVIEGELVALEEGPGAPPRPAAAATP